MAGVGKSLQEQAHHHEQIIYFDSAASKRYDAEQRLSNKKNEPTRHHPKTTIHSNRNAIKRGFWTDEGGKEPSFIGTSCRVAVHEAFFKVQPQCANAPQT
jgi:hypothetical protein